MRHSKLASVCIIRSVCAKKQKVQWCIYNGYSSLCIHNFTFHILHVVYMVYACVLCTETFNNSLYFVFISFTLFWFFVASVWFLFLCRCDAFSASFSSTFFVCVFCTVVTATGWRQLNNLLRMMEHTCVSLLFDPYCIYTCICQWFSFKEDIGWQRTCSSR